MQPRPILQIDKNEVRRMMKTFEMPKVEIVKFGAEDVITASSFVPGENETEGGGGL